MKLELCCKSSVCLFGSVMSLYPRLRIQRPSLLLCLLTLSPPIICSAKTNYVMNTYKCLNVFPIYLLGTVLRSEKLSDTTSLGIHLGYQKGHKNYHIQLLDNQQIFHSQKSSTNINLRPRLLNCFLVLYLCLKIVHLSISFLLSTYLLVSKLTSQPCLLIHFLRYHFQTQKSSLDLLHISCFILDSQAGGPHL